MRSITGKTPAASISYLLVAGLTSKEFPTWKWNDNSVSLVLSILRLRPPMSQVGAHRPHLSTQPGPGTSITRFQQIMRVVICQIINQECKETAKGFAFLDNSMYLKLAGFVQTAHCCSNTPCLLHLPGRRVEFHVALVDTSCCCVALSAGRSGTASGSSCRCISMCATSAVSKGGKSAHRRVDRLPV